MSRLGKKQIEIPTGVTVDISAKSISVKGPKGQLSIAPYKGIDVKVDGSSLVVSNTDPADRKLNAMHGTMRAHLNNMVVGVSEGFKRDMQIFGTGYNIKEQGGKLVLNVGYCHPVELKMPKGVSVEIKTAATRGNEVPAIFSISGVDKHQLGQFAAELRASRPPEPYKGKGVRYADEHIRRKVGKAFGA